MPLPPKTNKIVMERFGELVSESDRVLQGMVRENSSKREAQRQSGAFDLYELHVAETDFFSLRTRFLSLIEYISSANNNLRRIADDVVTLESTISDMKKLKGYISGLKQDYEVGLLDNLAMMIEAEVTSDYMSQAEQLLGEGIAGSYDHVPAAVLTGAVLEDTLRRLCTRQSPSISTIKSGGHPKTMGILIDDLKNAGLFNELKAKQLRAWVDIRNAAAHGEFDKFKREDVEQMLAGIQSFLADFM